ncbi:MAG TPA: CoA pyrophosphatase [Zeimonas sp.]
MKHEPIAPLPAFDPRELPVLDAHDGLPPVPAERLRIAALRERLANPPPWQPEQTADRFRIDRSDPRAAAVLVPIVAHAQASTVLLTQRTWNLRHHSGQVAFPGGRLEGSDATPVDAALREAHEEIGVAPSLVEVIGRLPEYLTGTGFLVTPVVGVLQPGFAVRPDPSEVADIFEVPLAFLMNPRHHQRRSVRDAGGAERTFFTMPYRVPGETEERFIWGATAAMLRNLYRLLVA